MAERFYLCIDLKSFFASVEAVDRGLDPFTTNLVVADPSRGRGSVCLAITPAMKALGIRNRCRVFEIPHGVEYITAMPRMKKYMEVSAQIYGIYLRYISPDAFNGSSMIIQSPPRPVNVPFVVVENRPPPEIFPSIGGVFLFIKTGWVPPLSHHKVTSMCNEVIK